MISRLQVTDLVQIVPAAARLESMGGEAALRIRAGVIELLVDSCDMNTLSTARFRILQRVGERQELRDAELRLMDEAILMLLSSRERGAAEHDELDAYRDHSDREYSRDYSDYDAQSIVPPAIGA
jgi:hypothetical protein